MPTFSKTFTPTAIEALDANGNSISITNPTRIIGSDADSTTYGQYVLASGSLAETFGWLSFDCSEIPDNATINNVTCTVKIYSSGNANAIKIRQLRMYLENRSTTKGFSVSMPTSTAAIALDLGTIAWTAEQLYGAEVRLYSQRNTKNVSSNYYVRIYGASLVVTWTVPVLHVNNNGTWEEVKNIYQKQNGIWVKKNS